MTDVVVTTKHLYTVRAWNGHRGYCARGARAWFDRHGLDWAAFVRDGIAGDVLLATGDAMATTLVEHARTANGR